MTFCSIYILIHSFNLKGLMLHRETIPTAPSCPKFLSPKQTRPLPAWRPRCSETPSHHKTKGRTTHSRSESTLLCSCSRKKNPRNWLPLDLISAVKSSLDSIICISQDKIYLTVLLLIKYEKVFILFQFIPIHFLK